MKIEPLSHALTTQVQRLMRLGAPYVRERMDSDYWLYAELFSKSCPVALIDNEVAGAVIAFRGQDAPQDMYVQDVMTHPRFRRFGVAKALLAEVEVCAVRWGCMRIYLTSEPENIAAHRTWSALGFDNLPADFTSNGIWVKKDYKGPGKDRALYQRWIKQS